MGASLDVFYITRVFYIIATSLDLLYFIIIMAQCTFYYNLLLVNMKMLCIKFRKNLTINEEFDFLEGRIHNNVYHWIYITVVDDTKF